MTKRYGLLTFAAVLCLLATGGPAIADTVYNNGPINGTINAWTINFGFSVSNSFTLTNASSLTSVQLGLWAEPGDVPTSVDWSIGTAEESSDLTSGTDASLSSVFQFTNDYGFDIYESSFSLGELLGPGTYWLTIQNGVSGGGGDPVYWDQNDDSSTAFQNGQNTKDICATGATCSESFQVFGTPPSSSVPEPSSMALMGSGLLMFAGFLRRKLSR
jgi:hypothetical protein